LLLLMLLLQAELTRFNSNVRKNNFESVKHKKGLKDETTPTSVRSRPLLYDDNCDAKTKVKTKAKVRGEEIKGEEMREKESRGKRRREA